MGNDYATEKERALLAEFDAAAEEVLRETLVKHDVQSWGCHGFGNPLKGAALIPVIASIEAAARYSR
jgi:hypothetical protein